MSHPHRRDLIRLAKASHARLMDGALIGKKTYRLRASEKWTPELEDILMFCAEKHTRFPKLNHFQPVRSTSLVKDIRRRRDQYHDYFLRYLKNYYWGKRRIPRPTVATKTDEALKVVFTKMTSRLSIKQVEKILDSHRKLMVAENAVGQLLERYIYTKLKRKGWIWCAGNCVRFVDFYLPSRKPNRLVLQIKNQTNSENSASSTVRDGTETIKWSRRNSKTDKTHWLTEGKFEGLPENDGSLTEEGFLSFVWKYKWASQQGP